MEPTNVVERLLEAAAQGVVARAELHRHLLESTLLVLGSRSGEAVRFRKFVGPAGQAVAAFTSHERLLDGLPPGTPYVELSGRALLEELGPDTGLVLNGHSRYGSELTPEEIAGMVARRSATGP